MAGLLRKDWYYLRAYGWPYLPLLALLSLSPGVMGPAYAMTLALALPRMTISSDALRWDRYAVMTPLRAEQIVTEKYLVQLACIALAAVYVALSFPVQNWAIRLAGRTEAAWSLGWQGILVYVLIQTWTAVLAAALALPLLYRLGTWRGQILPNILVILLLTLTGTVILNRLYVLPGPTMAAAAAVMAVPAALALALSYRLSVRLCWARLRGRWA